MDDLYDCEGGGESAPEMEVVGYTIAVANGIGPRCIGTIQVWWSNQDYQSTRSETIGGRLVPAFIPPGTPRLSAKEAAEELAAFLADYKPEWRPEVVALHVPSVVAA